MIHQITDKERNLSKMLQNATQRINDLEREVFEQARLLGMSCEREAALLAKIARQEKALKLALEALEKTTFLNEPKRIAATNATREVLGETK